MIIKPVTEYQHRDKYISLNTLATIPILKSRNALCTVESLIPLKYQLKNKCYTSPLAFNDLLLITCAKQKLIIRADVLTQCHSREGTYLCPDTILTSNKDSTWLGINWTPGTKFSFPRNHIKTSCDDLRPLIHLGGRFFLSTMEQRVRLTTRTITMTPLTVYHIPCNETASRLPTGFGQCPNTLTMSIPIFSKRNVKYIPWIVPANQSVLNLHYRSLKIGPRLRFNKTTIKALDDTFNRIDGPLQQKIELIKRDIASIRTTTITSTTQILACVALSLAVVNLIALIIMVYLIRRSMRPKPSTATVKYVKETNSLHLDPTCQQCDQLLTPADANVSDNENTDA